MSPFLIQDINKYSFSNLFDDSQRLTKIGQIMRKLSIDELPQLINIVKSDMSI